MELRQIKYFIEVAKREHVTEAANALHVAQSAVSRQIFKLEEELGVDLFVRKGRNVKLTTVGKMFLEHMEQAINVIDHAKQVVNEYTDPKRGTIHIGFTSTLAAFILPTVISAFREKYPDVQFKLKQMSHIALKEALLKGDLNVALIAPVPTDEALIDGSVLFSEKIMALLPINHPLASEKAITLRQLKNDMFVLFPEGYVLREMIEEGCLQFGFQPNIAFVGEDIDAIKGFVSAGLGVSCVPEISVVNNVPRATVAIPIVEPKLTRTVGVMIPTDRRLLPTENLFYEFTKAFFLRLEMFQK